MENRVEVLGRPSQESDIEPRLWRREQSGQPGQRSWGRDLSGGRQGGWFGWNEVTAGGEEALRSGRW